EAFWLRAGARAAARGALTMSSQQDAPSPRGAGGPIDEEARWQAYQAWLRKKREGALAAQPQPQPAAAEPPPRPASTARSPIEPRRARVGLIALTAVILTGAVVGGVSLLALWQGP